MQKINCSEEPNALPARLEARQSVLNMKERQDVERLS
jgi:hypothetical protein